MPIPAFGGLDALNVRHWHQKAFQQGRDESFFDSQGFISTGVNSPVQRITTLTKTSAGLECVIPLVADLGVDNVVVGDNVLEGNEATMYADAQSIKIDQIRYGVRGEGRMAEQATTLRFRENARDKLGNQIAQVKDELLFLTLAGIAYTKNLDGSTRAASQIPTLRFASDVVAPSSSRIVYGGTATALGNIAASDKFDWSLCIAARTRAQVANLRGIRVGGKEHFVLVLSPEQTRDLETDSTYMTNTGRAANRGPDNPLFRGAIAVVGGMVIYTHNKVPNTKGTATKYGAGSLVEGAQAMLLGAQAAAWADLGVPDWTESDKTDHGQKPAIGLNQVIGMLKPRFASQKDANTKQDFGVISIYTAAKI